MIDLAALDSYWIWLILAVVCGIGEIILPGVFLLWIAIAAALTGGITMLTGIGLPIQIILFAILSIVATYGGRRWYADNPVPSQDPLLNDRAARLIGETVTVVEEIRGGHGRVKVGDGVWACRGVDTAEGTLMRVASVSGNELVVEPL